MRDIGDKVEWRKDFYMAQVGRLSQPLYRVAVLRVLQTAEEAN